MSLDDVLRAALKLSADDREKLRDMLNKQAENDATAERIRER